MTCWLEDGVLYFQHYEKTISSKRLIPYRSAHTSTRLSWDNYFVSIVEQELCVRSHAFVGSKYSTWTDTVKGKRSYLKNENNFQFEELWALGIK